MNLLKINIKDYKAYLGHDNRTMYDYNGIKNGKKRLPKNIVKELVNKNYELESKELNGLPFEDLVNGIIKKNNKIKKMRDNQVCLGSWVIQIPDEPKLNEEQQKRFFSSCFNFIKGRYKSICKGYVHYDEPNGKPHIHILVLPFENEEGKLNAKKVFNRHDLQTIHKDISTYLTKSLQVPINMLNDKTIRDENGKALNVKELKDRKIIVNNYREIKKENAIKEKVLSDTFKEIKQEHPKVYEYIQNKIDVNIKRLNEKPNKINRIKQFFKKLLHIKDKNNTIEMIK